MATIAQPRRIYPLVWAAMFLVIVIFVGLRHHVGMDWNNYLIMIRRANIGSWVESFAVSESGYATLLWISGQMNWGVYGAYLMGTLIFAAGLFRYARTTPYPWIALTVAMPYLVVVVAMSAGRQTVAVGVLFWLLAGWHQMSVVWRVALVLLAASFHASAVIFLVLVVIDIRMRRVFRIPMITMLLGIIGYGFVSSDAFAFYEKAYVTGGEDREAVQADGALFHVLLNAGPAALAFALGPRTRAILLPDPLHRNLAMAALLMLPLTLVASVVASRFSIYLFPVSMMVISTLPVLFHSPQDRFLLRGSFAFFFAMILYVWLAFANSARAYLNYSNVLFMDPSHLVLCCR